LGDLVKGRARMSREFTAGNEVRELAITSAVLVTKIYCPGGEVIGLRPRNTEARWPCGEGDELKHFKRPKCQTKRKHVFISSKRVLIREGFNITGIIKMPRLFHGHKGWVVLL